MFRIRTPDTHKPLFVANAVLEEYAENRVDTLHTKNLLHLGEDRYLTTLVLKHFGSYKTIFVRDAKAQTAAPEDWAVLLSQRRRWINSTVHNLYELINTPGLCGFCLFSMRFIVFIDLLSTVIAPVTMVYLVYLVVWVATDNGSVPLTSLIMLVAIYGLQAIIFLLRRRFDMLIWMLIYICGLPIWTFFLPLYAFWHMDDFSWGNTRVVMGEKGQKIITHDEGTFHASEIPQQTWHSYEEELWERNSARSIGSMLLDKMADEQRSRAGSNYTPSLYGAQPLTHRNSPSYGHSPSGSTGMPTSRMGSQTNLVSGYFGQGQIQQPTGYDYLGRQSSYSMGGTDMMQQQQQLYQQQGPRSGYATPASMYGMPTFPSQVPANFSASQYGSRANSLHGMPIQHQQPVSPYYAQAGGGGGSISGRSTPGGGLEMPLVDTTIRGFIPTDDVVARDIRTIIISSDLATVTKKSIRARLEEKYQTSVAEKKAFINETIDRVLAEV
jgi:chitin synthase